jgi:hypothetical protein
MAIICIGLFQPVMAKHSDAFALGVYSSLSNSSKDDQLIRDTLCNSMQALGYNVTMMHTRSSDRDLPGLLSDMDSHGLDAVINDFSWNPDKSSSHRFASHPLSISNYLRFEAEFSDESDIKPGDRLDSQYWYSVRDEKGLPRQGSAVMAPGSSYGWVWNASQGTDRAGHIFTDLRYRWPNKNGAYVRFGAEFMLHQNNPPKHEGDYIRVNYRFRITNVKGGLDPSEPLLRFYLAGYTFSGTGFSREAKVLVHNNKGQELTETIYTLQDHYSSRGDGGFIDLQLKVPYLELLEAGLMTLDHDLNPSTPDSRERMRLINLNPRIYWYGNCDVQLDYVEIEDQIHHELTTEKDYWSRGIGGRMREVMGQSAGNIRAFYTFDEPYIGQFDSFNIIQDIASQTGTEIYSANYDYQYQNFVLDNASDFRYDHLGAYRKLAKPLILAPDIYPIYPGLGWNMSDRETGTFIQDVLDDKLIRIYKDCKQYRDELGGRSFFPIVQVLGNWVKSGDREQWTNWIQPPLATQKSLLFLPLCYGPDGIMHYCLRATQTSEGYGYRGISYSRKGTTGFPYPQPDHIAWTAVASTNARVLEYGKLIRKLTWLGSETIGTKASGSRKLNKRNQLSSIKVKKAKNGDYEGYVQCAYYQDAKGQPWFMLVNRRANFFTPGAITDPRYVPAEQFGDYFQEAAPQTLSMKFDKKAVKEYRGNFGLYDPVDKKTYAARKGVIEIPIPAGEGRLLQLVRTKS